MSAPKVRYAEVADNGIPTGGTTGQVLKKSSASDLDVEWGSSDAAANGIPAGGTTGQIPAKASDADYDVAWTNAPSASNGLPTGGTAGQVLKKKSAADYDADWEDAKGITNGLMAEYLFSENADDTSGNDYNGTATNVTYGTGLNGQCGIFAATGYITINPAAYLFGKRRPFSVVIWFKTNTISSTYMALFTSNQALSSGWTFRALSIAWNANSGGKLGFGCAASSSYTWSGIEFTGTYNDGNWHMLTLTSDGINMFGIIDDFAEKIYLYLGTYVNPAQSVCAIGADIQGGNYGERFTGDVDSVRIYERVLTRDEIKKLWNNGSGS